MNDPKKEEDNNLLQSGDDQQFIKRHDLTEDDLKYKDQNFTPDEKEK